MVTTYHTIPAENGYYHTIPADNGNYHTIPAENGDYHTIPAENGNSHTIPAENGNYNTIPAENGNYLPHNIGRCISLSELERRGLHTQPEGRGAERLGRSHTGWKYTGSSSLKHQIEPHLRIG